MKTSSTSRKEKQAKAAQAIITQHRLWTVRLQEIMHEKRVEARAALPLLEKEVKENYHCTPAQCKLQYKMAWLEYMRMINSVK